MFTDLFKPPTPSSLRPSVSPSFSLEHDLPPHDDIPLDLKKLAIRFSLALLGFITLMALLGIWLYQPLLALSKVFVKTLGGWGVAIGFFLPDAIAFPLPNDAFTFLGLKGGLGFWPVVFWATAGSILGGCVGYLIGQSFRHTAWFRRVLKNQGAETYALTRRYGLVALVLGALTPIPYSFTCWACGAINLPFWQFLLVSLLRLPRVAFYLWLIQIGFLKMANLGVLSM